ncbi:hypothetical protein FQ775_03280 [Nitratireductor mangrovi]|uniref:Uncharacterized protein n=1 Tax=Nitratireductor mangrovi TaxID=2599600 RepID=A0A5B8KV80_9HYPH|nr:hypothetical protein [Nitratireductor mangrovi]QDY99471.1 hypothetical protein FQ775_03280 [Nitratireductor mangrovi]
MSTGWATIEVAGAWLFLAGLIAWTIGAGLHFRLNSEQWNRWLSARSFAEHKRQSWDTLRDIFGDHRSRWPALFGAILTLAGIGVLLAAS